MENLEKQTRNAAKIHMVTKTGEYHVFDSKSDAQQFVTSKGGDNIPIVIKGHSLSLKKKVVESYEWE